MRTLIKSDRPVSGPEEDIIPHLLIKAWESHAHKQFAEVHRMCRRILSLNPDHCEALHLLGLAFRGQGDHDSALSCLERARDAQPDHPVHCNSLAVVLNEMGQYDRAAVCLREVLRMCPDHADARSNLGLALFHQGRLAQAAQSFQEAIAVDPVHAPAWANLGMIRLVQGNYSQAVDAYQKALQVDAKRPHWLSNLGAALIGLGKYQQAAVCYKAALSIVPQDINYCVGLGVALRGLGDFSGSIKILEKALAGSPGHADALANLAVVCQHACVWQKSAELHDQLEQTTRSCLDTGQLPAEQPLFNIRRCADLSLNLSVARAWSSHAEQQALRSAGKFEHKPGQRRSDRITLGYLSYDFRDHPVAQQLLPLFRRHDRNRFRVLAFSMGPDDHSEYRRRYENDCDEFIDIKDQSQMASAQTIYDHRVDILIDLMGHTDHHRIGILALRPAPVQIGYLGFLGTTGSSFTDYLITDSIVVPHSHADCYSEKLIRMPYCYQMNHQELTRQGKTCNRSDWGLPEDAFIFCSFNQAYKIDPDLFDAWMHILEQVPGAVIWLYRDNDLAADHLKTAAEKRGIDRNRLIFAGKLPLADHLQRLKLADMALDTTAYNGGATTSNALLAGIPVLTVLGRHWVSRMTASHLLAIGMPELVAKDLTGYRQKAVDLARHPDRLLSLKRKLRRNSDTMPLFDAEMFVRHLEKGLCQAWNNFQSGRPAAHISIETIATHAGRAGQP